MISRPATTRNCPPPLKPQSVKNSHRNVISGSILNAFLLITHRMYKNF
uniref:Uncharacterized protein n=1 Tax=Anguilla anguilla TaxID=7936 RepID=A0A0E9TY23_ANGAN